MDGKNVEYITATDSRIRTNSVFCEIHLHHAERILKTARIQRDSGCFFDSNMQKKRLKSFGKKLFEQEF